MECVVVIAKREWSDEFFLRTSLHVFNFNYNVVWFLPLLLLLLLVDVCGYLYAYHFISVLVIGGYSIRMVVVVSGRRAFSRSVSLSTRTTAKDFIMVKGRQKIKYCHYQVMPISCVCLPGIVIAFLNTGNCMFKRRCSVVPEFWRSPSFLTLFI